MNYYHTIYHNKSILTILFQENKREIYLFIFIPDLNLLFVFVYYIDHRMGIHLVVVRLFIKKRTYTQIDVHVKKVLYSIQFEYILYIFTQIFICMFQKENIKYINKSISKH